MKIVIDAMGGDNAPMEIVRGALEAAKEDGLELILTGRGEEILGCMAELGMDTLPKNVEIANAQDVVTMEDDPSSVLREKENSSMAAAFRILKDGAAEAMVGAGNTGALLAGATLMVKRQPCVRRAALATMLPASHGSVLLIDSGANADPTAEMLLQFAVMGTAYVRRSLHIREPRVGLLNIGAESAKGTDLQREAYALLTEAANAGKLNFVGNVESREAILGSCDVLVADGFSGNVLLKGLEGMGILMLTQLRELLETRGRTKIAAKLAMEELRFLEQRFDAAEIGGAVLLGIQKPVVKAHGASDARAVKNAILQAVQLVKSGIAADIARELSADGTEMQR